MLAHSKPYFYKDTKASINFCSRVGVVVSTGSLCRVKQDEGQLEMEEEEGSF